MYDYSAKLIRVVDGDTIVVEVDLGFYLKQEMPLRLFGINTPEIKGPTKAAGLVSKQFVETELAANPVLGVRTYKLEKYGRYLAEVFYGPEGTDKKAVFTGGKLLNAELLQRDLAVRATYE